MTGSTSIRVTTLGYYQGARIDLKNPIDLTGALANPRTFLRLHMRFAGTTQSVVDPETLEVRQTAASPFSKMRFLLTMADGSQYETIRPVEIQGAESPDAWVPVNVPLISIIHKPAAAPAETPATTPAAAPAVSPATAPAEPLTGNAVMLASIAVGGDRYQQFNIGDIDIITDDTNILIDPLDEKIAFVQDQLTFTATAQGGASTLRYSWDFDGDKKEDKTGKSVQQVWRKPGKYNVVLTVSDIDGLKPPATTSVVVDVSQ